MPLKVLHFAFVLLRGGARRKCAEVSTLSGLAVFLARVKTVMPVGEFADHDLRSSLMKLPRFRCAAMR
jgi:hypothetical protein